MSDVDTKNLSGTTYSLLKNELKDVEYICIGEDCVREMYKWTYSEELIKEYKFIVFGRGKEESEDMWYKKEPHLFIDYHTDISSSNFRETKDFNILAEVVSAYIKQHYLYK